MSPDESTPTPPESLSINKDTLADLDVPSADAAGVNGGLDIAAQDTLAAKADATMLCIAPTVVGCVPASRTCLR